MLRRQTKSELQTGWLSRPVQVAAVVLLVVAFLLTALAHGVPRAVGVALWLLLLAALVFLTPTRRRR
jgi:uncharacterized membrane protein